MTPIDTPRLITVFGGGGFIGRYVCERLMDAGARVRVVTRDPRTAHFIQPLGQVGQFGLVRGDVTNRKSVERAVDDADAVINLVGSFSNMRAIHVDGARNVAEAAKDAGAGALVHISAIGADEGSESAYGRTKGLGERAVREAFPSAAILRPSIVFGPEDEFTNRFAALGALPVMPVLKPDARFQPVYVEDLAQAVVKAAIEPAHHAGKTYEIAGPDVMSFRSLIATILRLAGRDPYLVDLPDFASSAMSYLGFLPGAPITRDQWLMLQSDNVAAADVPGLKQFGIDPTPLAAVAEEWLVSYRQGGRFAMRTSPRQSN